MAGKAGVGKGGWCLKDTGQGGQRRDEEEVKGAAGEGHWGRSGTRTQKFMIKQDGTFHSFLCT